MALIDGDWDEEQACSGDEFVCVGVEEFDALYVRRQLGRHLLLTIVAIDL